VSYLASLALSRTRRALPRSFRLLDCVRVNFAIQAFTKRVCSNFQIVAGLQTEPELRRRVGVAPETQRGLRSS